MITDSNLAIEAKGLNKNYKKNNKEIKALINFNIQIPRGVIYGLLGPNGAGKSTFINILGGLVKKSSGEIRIHGLDIEEHTRKTRGLIGIVPQELNMDPFFTPQELLETQAGLYGVSKKNRRTCDILKKVGLNNESDSYARTLSGGMRRRLLVAKALVHNPRVIILDEPTAGVDVELRKNLWGYIKELNTQGVTVCLTTHYLEEAEQLCDYITIINNGKILKSGTKQQILNLISQKTANFILEKNLNELPKNIKQYNPILNGNNLSIIYDKNQTKITNIINDLEKANIKFSEINTYESDLEDVFVQLIKK